MVTTPTFVFLLHSPVPEFRPSQLDRVEQKLDSLTLMLGRLIRSLAEEDEQQVGTTLDGGPAGQERDTTQGLG